MQHEQCSGYNSQLVQFSVLSNVLRWHPTIIQFTAIPCPKGVAYLQGYVHNACRVKCSNTQPRQQNIYMCAALMACHNPVMRGMCTRQIMVSCGSDATVQEVGNQHVVMPVRACARSSGQLSCVQGWVRSCHVLPLYCQCASKKMCYALMGFDSSPEPHRPRGGTSMHEQ